MLDKGLDLNHSKTTPITIDKIPENPIPALYQTKIDSKVSLVEQQALPPWIQDSFLDGRYRTVVTDQDIVVYRVYGGYAKATGGFVTTDPAMNKIQSKIDLALLPEWKNTRQYETTIVVPKGTVLNIGKVAPQTIRQSGTVLEGGADQVLLPPNWPNEWIKETREVKP